MAKKSAWRAKWILLYIAIVVGFILSLILTLIFMKNGAAKFALIIYEAAFVGASIALPIGTIQTDKKNKKKD